MKKNNFLLLITLLSIVNTAFGQTSYKNDKYGFGVEVPDDWYIYADVKDNPIKDRAIIDWGLPKVYSELEKTEIENAVSVTAYRKKDLQNIQDLTKLEFRRIHHMLESKKLVDSLPYHTYEVITVQGGLKYKSRFILVYKNDIGYVINYTATPGTYHMNLTKFEDFFNALKFFEPKESPQQSFENANINYKGLYVAKTKEMQIAGNTMEFFTYLRFYENGSVYTQTVNSYEPESVSKWFGENLKFEKSGQYSVIGDSISFVVNNMESPDMRIEGPLSTSFEGVVTDKNHMRLLIKPSTGEAKSYEFEFVPDIEEFTIYFGHLDKKIFVPGKWEQLQIIEGGQVFIINEDSTTIGVVVYKPEQISVCKEGMSNFEMSKAYHEWDAKYFESEMNMKVELIQEDKANASILWHAKDKYNNSYYLFGCDGKLLYNLMIDGEKLLKEDKLSLLKEIYQRNVK